MKFDVVFYSVLSVDSPSLGTRALAGDGAIRLRQAVREGVSERSESRPDEGGVSDGRQVAKRSTTVVAPRVAISLATPSTKAARSMAPRSFWMPRARTETLFASASRGPTTRR